MTYEMDGFDSDGASDGEATLVERTEYGADSYADQMSDGSVYTYERQEFGDGESITENWDYPDGSYSHHSEISNGDYGAESTVEYDGDETYEVDHESLGGTDMGADSD